MMSPPHFCKASLGEGTPLPVVAFQLSPTPGYPIEVILLCKVSGKPGARTQREWEQLLTPGKSVVLLAGLRTEWTQPEFSGYAYRISGTVGLDAGSIPLQGQFMVHLRHADHGPAPAPVAPVTRDTEPDYQRLLDRFAEGTPPETLHVDESEISIL